jgi:insertion element IS1 protein InsB
MIEELIVYYCEKCNSANIVRNGHTPTGKQKYHCRECGHYGRLDKAPRYSESDKETILKTSLERSSLRGLGRVFRVARETVIRWLKKTIQRLQSLKKTTKPAETGDVVEVDELWSFVGSKKNQQWVWVALCRRTREIIAFAIGNRDEKMARQLWRNIPADYRKKAIFYSDFWKPYLAVFPAAQHEAVSKQSGETAHIERWNNTLRQRLGRFVRLSLSFSKLEQHHFLHLRFFIDRYNSALSALM